MNNQNEAISKIINNPLLVSTSNNNNNDHTPKGGYNFPLKLHTMLEDVEKMGKGEIVSWQPHGRCFRVHKQRDFTEQIMPLFFGKIKWSSFTRQLQIYGFERFTSPGLDKNGYYHRMFLRGKPHLSGFILRSKAKKIKIRKSTRQYIEPNYYTMPYVGVGGNSDNSDTVEQNIGGDDIASDISLSNQSISNTLETPIPFLTNTTSETNQLSERFLEIDPDELLDALGCNKSKATSTATATTNDINKNTLVTPEKIKQSQTNARKLTSNPITTLKTASNSSTSNNIDKRLQPGGDSSSLEACLDWLIDNEEVLGLHPTGETVS